MSAIGRTARKVRKLDVAQRIYLAQAIELDAMIRRFRNDARAAMTLRDATGKRDAKWAQLGGAITGILQCATRMERRARKLRRLGGEE